MRSIWNSIRHPHHTMVWFSFVSLALFFALSMMLLVSCDDSQDKQLFSVWTLQENDDTKLAEGTFRVLDLTGATVGFNKVVVTGSGAISLEGNQSPSSSIQRKIEETTEPASTRGISRLPPPPEEVIESDGVSEFDSPPPAPGGFTNPTLVTEVQAKLATRQIKITLQGNQGALMEILDRDTGDLVETRFLELSSDKQVLTICGEFLFAFKSCSRYK